MRLLPCLLAAAFSAAGLHAAPQGEPEEAQKVDFAAQIKPIFKARCYECHGVDDPEGDLRLDIRSGLFHDGGSDEWVVVLGKADESLLFERLTLPADDPDIMPAEGDPLSADEIALIKRWINEGAEWPKEADAAVAKASAPAVDALVLPELSPAAAAGRGKALEALRARGVMALAVAANTSAVEVSFGLLGKQVADTDLALLDGLESTLVWLDLGRTLVTDAGVARLSRFSELRRLNLANTGVGDRALEVIGTLAKLEYCNLYGTAVTDAGLDALGGLAALRKVFLWQSKVTDAGAARLAKMLPAASIDLGRYVEAIREVTKATTPINAKCVVLEEKKVDPAYIVKHDGVVIGFCCGKCKAKFVADPAKFAGKLK